LASVAFGDFDIALKHGVIAEAELQSRNGHGLRNSAKVKHTLLAEAGKVENAVLHMLQSI
jgi:hypothetical protein